MVIKQYKNIIFSSYYTVYSFHSNHLLVTIRSWCSCIKSSEISWILHIKYVMPHGMSVEIIKTVKFFYVVNIYTYIHKNTRVYIYIYTQKYIIR